MKPHLQLDTALEPFAYCQHLEDLISYKFNPEIQRMTSHEMSLLKVVLFSGQCSSEFIQRPFDQPFAHALVKKKKQQQHEV